MCPLCVSELELDYLPNTPEGVSSLLLNLEMNVEKVCSIRVYVMLHNEEQPCQRGLLEILWHSRLLLREVCTCNVPGKGTRMLK